MAKRTVLYKRERHIITIYVSLVALSFFGIISANFMSPTNQEAVIGYSGDAFKVSIGALLGALSALLGVGANE